MSRNVTVTFSNGQTHVFNNVPQDVTPEQVTARAQQEFPDFGTVTALDGGNSARKGSAEAPYSPEEYAAALQSDALRPGDQVLQADGTLGTYRGRTAEGATTNTDVGGVPTVSMSEEEYRDNILRYGGLDIAAARREGEGQLLRSARGLAAGLGYEMLGIGPRIEAGIDVLTGQTPLDYGDQLKVRRAMGEYDMQANPVSSTLLGRLPGGVITAMTGGAAGRGAQVAARAAGAPRVANAIQSLTTLERGTRANRAVGANAGRIARNAARLSAEGALQSGAVALANDQDDVATEALIGAVGAPLVAGSMQGVRAVGGDAVGRGMETVGNTSANFIRQALGRPLVDLSDRRTGRSLQNFIEESPEALAARQAQMSQDVGRNVPLAAALRDDDFAAVGKEVVPRSPEAIATAQREATTGLRTFMDRAAALVSRAGQDASTDTRNFAGRVTGSRDNLQTTVGQLDEFRTQTMNEAMEPIRMAQVGIDGSVLDDPTREAIREIGSRTPALRQAVRDILSASPEAEVAAAWGVGRPLDITVEEADHLRRALSAASRSAENSNPANAAAYRNAAEAISTQASDQVPAYGEALSTYAANSRVIEGFENAAKGSRADDVRKGQLRRNLDTPEGQVGRALGELYRQRENVTSNVSSAIRTMRQYGERGALTRGLPEGAAENVGRPGSITTNVGPEAAETLARTADVENRIVDRLTDTERLRNTLRDGSNLNIEDITYGVSLLGGNSMAATRGRFMARLLNKVDRGIDPRVAENITEMLFSSDPAQTQRAITALAAAGINRRTFASELAAALPTAHASQVASGATQRRDDRQAGAVEEIVPVAAETPVAVEEMEVEVPTSALESPYYADVEDYYRTMNPEFLQLVNDMLMQESGGRQVDAEGNVITSSAGAIGIAQVMPETGPEAAADAGLPWDEEAYYNDEAYNLLIGAAYLGKLLDKYEGDVEKALAAYNGGMGRVDNALARGGDWLGQMPAETQNYVSVLR